jgi:hypothetical protein
MVINGHLNGRTNQMAGSIDMLPPPVGLALAVGLVARCWPARQSVVEGFRKE